MQEAWIRLQRAEIDAIKNLEAWLTTVISRVCIDMIRHRASHPEDLDLEHATESDSAVPDLAFDDPASSAMVAEDVAIAMQVVLETLGPLERLAVVLHDVFGMSFDDIGPIVERTSTAARQLASRARTRLREVEIDATRDRHAAAVDAFLDAARRGDFGALLLVLDPDIELRADDAAVALAADAAAHGAPLLNSTVRGVDAVTRIFAGRAEQAFVIRVDGVPAAGYVADGSIRAVYFVHFEAGKIARLDVVADVDTLKSLSAVL